MGGIIFHPTDFPLFFRESDFRNDYICTNVDLKIYSPNSSI